MAITDDPWFFSGFTPLCGESRDSADVYRYHQPVLDENEVDGLFRVYPFGPVRPHTDSNPWCETRWARAEYL